MDTCTTLTPLMHTASGNGICGTMVAHCPLPLFPRWPSVHRCPRTHAIHARSGHDHLPSPSHMHYHYLGPLRKPARAITHT